MVSSSTQYWHQPAPELLQDLQASPQGLSEADSAQRIKTYGPNRLQPRQRHDALTLFLAQFKSPLVIILLCAAVLSFFLDSRPEAVIILVIVCLSSLLSFWQEYSASDAVQKLLAIVQLQALVRRGGVDREVPVEEIVPGDIVILAAGDIIPADGVILESKDLFVDEAALTGETFPVEKNPNPSPVEAPLSQRLNCVFMGTHVVSGWAQVLVVHTGKETEFGQVSQSLAMRPPMTEFERGVRRFGYFLMEVTLILILLIFAGNVFLHRPVIDSFLFSLALAVGLTPQLLPAIIAINLAAGAKKMAAQRVIVKRLAAIENFGSMDVLCADKTGTLTEGQVHIHAAVDLEGRPSPKTMLYGYLNAVFETGFANPIDAALKQQPHLDSSGYRKLDEVPYDFIRKRLSVLLAHAGQCLMITKGAAANVLSVCTKVETADGSISPLLAANGQIQKIIQEYSEQGYRLLAVAYRQEGPECQILTKESETDLTLVGFLALFDPPKPGVLETIQELNKLGVSLKIITGDNHLIAQTVSKAIGLASVRILTGPQLRHIDDMALIRQVQMADIFAEVEPNQKDRIIAALKKAGHVVGFMGDGINDAPALHTADVSISVNSAVDVAKEAADIVLLDQDLKVLVAGIQSGRTTFANTLKYVFMATSANFGNMFSMAGASLLLPFLPLLPTQILLTNLLTDFPEMTIATDSVDPELVDQPRRWDIHFIRKFMIVFGLLSSVFDYLTFGVLHWLLQATPQQFRTGWFQESVISAALIVLVIRSRRPFYRSRPGKYLFAATLLTIGLTLLLPLTPLAPLFEFERLPVFFLGMLGGIVVLYVLGAELVKKFFYQGPRRQRPARSKR
jgi:P-type Mg2+ transporter